MPSSIAKIEITDHGHRAADLAEGCDPKDTVAEICPGRFRGCLRKFVPAVHPLRRRGTKVVAARRYVTSLRTADSVLATDNLSLAKDAPEPRPVQGPQLGRIVAIPQVGGLHHRYERRAA